MTTIHDADMAPVDCRECVHCTDLIEAEGAICALPEFRTHLAWSEVTDGTCSLFESSPRRDPDSPPASADREGSVASDVLDAMREAADDLDATQTGDMENPAVRRVEAALRRAISSEEARRARPAVGKPEPAGFCSKCQGPVYHRDGKPGEYDHECGPAVEDPRDAAAIEEALDAWRTMRQTPFTDATNSTVPWVRAYGRAEKLLDALADLRAAGVEPASAKEEETGR